MGIVRELVSEGLDRLVSFLENFDESAILLVTRGAFIYKKDLDGAEMGDLKLIFDALKQKRIKNMGNLVFSGVKINYRFNFKTVRNYYTLLANYIVAREVVRFTYTLPSVTGRVETVNLVGANSYGFEIRIDPLTSVAVFSFNMDLKLAPLATANRYIGLDPIFKKVLATMVLLKEATFLNLVKNNKEELKTALLSVFGEFI